MKFRFIAKTCLWFSLLCIFTMGAKKITTTPITDDGVRSGGGGSEWEAKFISRSWEVLRRIRQMESFAEVQDIVVDIEQTLKSQPPKVELVAELVDCSTGRPVSQKKDAWGCPGRIQLLSTFNLQDDSLIFHELTRVTKKHFSADEGMRLSISKLGLNKNNIKTVVVFEEFYKQVASLENILKKEKLLRKAGALATNIREDRNKYTIVAVWEVIDSDSTHKPDVTIDH